MPTIPTLGRSWRQALRASIVAATGIHTMKGVDGWMREKRSRRSFSNIRVVSPRPLLGRRAADPALGMVPTLVGPASLRNKKSSQVQAAFAFAAAGQVQTAFAAAGQVQTAFAAA